MERRQQPYSIQKRPIRHKNRFMFYVKFRNPETGRYMNAESSGCTNRDDAIRWAEKKLKSNLVARKNPRFADYVEGLWDIGARYAQGRIVRGKSISNGTLETARNNTRNHLVPRWGDLKLQSISAGMIDAWLIELHKDSGLSASTINRLLRNLRVILTQAAKDGIIPANPAISLARSRDS